jgi:enoyl-CoA hydratase/carnithine racemase
MHNAWSQLWMELDNDPENEVLIFGGTSDQWFAGFDPEMSRQPLHEMPGDAFYDQLYHDSTNLLEAFIFNIEISTIACINGPGLHTESACSVISRSVPNTRSCSILIFVSTSSPVTGRG